MSSNSRPRLAPEILDREPPCDLEAERAVLGSVILDPRRLAEVREVAGPEHFHDHRNEIVYRHVLRLANAGSAVDVTLLCASLKSAGELQAAGGAIYLAEVLQSVPVAAHAVYYAEIVRDKADRRGLLRLCERGLQLAHDGRDWHEVQEELSELFDPEAGKPPEPPPFALMLSSEELARLDKEARFLVRGVMIEGQPMVVGARSKTLKTTLAEDLAISIGSGTPSLGRFDSQQASVGFWSGESGASTIRETALRIAKAKGLNLGDCSVHWSFDLPRLSRADHLDVLRSVIRDRGIKVAIFDPLYLCLLSGETAGMASNLFGMGAILQPLSAFAQEAGVTLVVLHHFRKSGQADDAEPAGLEELTQSGAAEWARQWILLQRRTPYQGDGRHSLWARTGGSAGHAGLWALNINEGVFAPDAPERRWEVEVKPVSDAREQAKREKADRKAAEVEQTEAEHVDRLRQALCDNPDGLTEKRLRTLTRLNVANLDRALLSLEKTGRLEPCKVQTSGGSFDGWRLKKA